MDKSIDPPLEFGAWLSSFKPKSTGADYAKHLPPKAVPGRCLALSGRQQTLKRLPRYINSQRRTQKKPVEGATPEGVRLTDQPG